MKILTIILLVVLNTILCVLLSYSLLWSQWSIETVDSSNNAGYYCSIAVDKGRKPHISYYNSNGELKYATWTGMTWDIGIVNEDNLYNYNTAIKLDNSGYPHITYASGFKLKHAKWNGSSWVTETIDSTGSAGYYNSLAIDGNNNFHVSYLVYEGLGRVLKYAVWNGVSWTIKTVDYNVASQGGTNAIAVDKNNSPHICYKSGSDVNYLQPESLTSSNVEHTSMLAEAVSIAVDSDGFPHVAYTAWKNYVGVELKYAKWDGTYWYTSVVESGGVAANRVSIILDKKNKPHICYTANNALKHATWTATSWDIEIIDSNVGQYYSLAVDSRDNLHVAYCDVTNARLKYAKYLVSTPPSTLEKVLVYPNPFRSALSDHANIGITIGNVPANTNLKIYTFSGELVRQLKDDDSDGIINWNAKNENGESVASGVYFGLLEADGSRKTAKIAIQR